MPGKPHGKRSLAGYSPWGCRVKPDRSDLAHAHKGPHSQFSHIRRGWGFSLQVWGVPFSTCAWALTQHLICRSGGSHWVLVPSVSMPSLLFGPPGAVSHCSLPMPMPYSSIRSQVRDPPSLAPSLRFPSGPPSHTHSMCSCCHRQLGRCSAPASSSAPGIKTLLLFSH